MVPRESQGVSTGTREEGRVEQIVELGDFAGDRPGIPEGMTEGFQELGNSGRGA